MLAQVIPFNTPILFILLGILFASYYALQLTRHELRIRKIGGIRAPLLAKNVFSSAIWFLNAARAHRRNEFLNHFNRFFEALPPGRPDCVEIQVRPRERYILTRDPEHIKTVLTGKFTSFGKGPQFHQLWRPFLGDSIFTTDGQLWHDSRSLIRPMFVKDRVSDLATFERGVAALMAQLPPSGCTTDIMDLLYRMTLDVTTDFLLGASADSLNNPKNEFVSAFNEVQSIQMMLTMVGPFESLVPRRRYNRGIETIDRFVMPYINRALALPQEDLEKMSNSDEKFTFLHSVARYTRDPRMLRDQLVAVLLAGRDTTAATLSWAFYELCRYPEKYRRLRREVIDALGGSRDRKPGYEDLKGMTYLRHTLNETLRLYPAVPYNLRAALEDTTLPPGVGVEPGQQPGISVIEGDIVIYSALAMQRRPDLYPPVSETFADPAVFSPERWETWTPKPWHHVPFNGGPRICVGQNFAMTEMAYCMVRILQKYDRLEYRGDWHAQKHEAEVVGRPSQGVKVALYEESPDIVGWEKGLETK